MLKIENLTIQHNSETTLQYPDFELEQGEELVITGPSGTGKTTLLHLLAGLLTPTSGVVQFGDLAVSRVNEVKREAYRRQTVGYVFQDFYLMPGLSALENVELGLRVANIQQPQQKATAALKQLDLGHRLRNYPTDLSTGERQRVAVARAVAHQPKLLLVDEPTAHLDRDRAQGALELLKETAKQLAATLVVVTHDPLVVEAMSRRLELNQSDVSHEVSA